METKWICTVCGYVHEDEEAPKVCPICKQTKSKFSKLKDEDTDEAPK